MSPGQDEILEWIERGESKCDFTLLKNARTVRALWRRYANVPMSLANARVVRMAEIYPRAPVCTLDSDFAIYHKAMKTPLNLLTPVS